MSAAAKTPPETTGKFRNSPTPRGTGSSEVALIRIGSSTAGCAAIGGAVGSLFGPAGSGVGIGIGGVIGFVASAAESLKSKSDG